MTRQLLPFNSVPSMTLILGDKKNLSNNSIVALQVENVSHPTMFKRFDGLTVSMTDLNMPTASNTRRHVTAANSLIG